MKVTWAEFTFPPINLYNVFPFNKEKEESVWSKKNYQQHKDTKPVLFLSLLNMRKVG